MLTAVIARYFIISNAAIIGAAIIAGVVIYYILLLINRNLHRRNQKSALFHRSLERQCRGPLKLLIPALTLDLIVPALTLNQHWSALIDHVIGVIIIAAASWLLVSLVFVGSEVLLSRYDPKGPDGGHARAVHTQIEVFKRIFLVAVTILAGALILMSFSWGRELGGSLLASAGIAGLAVGLAARPTLENVVAGVQLAVTQPFRLEDAVIVENDWGWIEEIKTTYVVVRTWDLRRLILPLTYFITHPFQNWDRTSPQLIGIVHVYVDYTAPLEEIRQEFTRLVKSSSRWDGQVCVLQVTHCNERCIELRGLCSATDSGTTWDLRCEVREKLIEFIQRNYPYCLPKTRAEVPPSDGSNPQTVGAIAAMSPSPH